MDISLFPKGRYIAKNAKLHYKYSYSPTRGSTPFAITINDEKYGSSWELEAFRPSPYSENVNDGSDIIVLYEKVNTSKLCKIPRYLYLIEQQKWLVNTR